MRGTISLVIADDQQLFREALKTLLGTQAGVEIIGEAANGRDAIQAARKYHPDLVLMDLRMPVMDGVQATRVIRTELPQTQVLILTTFDDDSDLFQGLKAGAIGYLLKDISAELLMEGIRTASRGEFFLMPSATARIVAEFSRLSAMENEIEPISYEKLTRREIEILKFVATGISNREIAELLVITEGTVKNHISNILGKLDAKDRLQAVARAQQKGWI